MNSLFAKFKWELNLYRRKIIWDDSDCVFIHIPKAAGTSVNHALYGRTLGHYSAREINKKFPKFFEQSFTFSLARNPWDRALSAYRFACVGQTESMGVYKPEQYQIPEFSSFERFVCDWLPSIDTSRCDFIFKPQYFFVCDQNKKLMVDHLGYVERFAETVCFLEERLGRSIDVKKVNATSVGNRSYRDAYTSNDMVEIVRSVYQDDVKIFGYEF